MSNKFLTFTASEIQFLRHCPLEQHRDCLSSLYLAAWCPNKQNFCRRRVSCHRFTEVRCERCSNMWDKISLKQRVGCAVQLDSGLAHIETSQHKWWWLRSNLITLLLSWFSGLELNLVSDERSPVTWQAYTMSEHIFDASRRPDSLLRLISLSHFFLSLASLITDFTPNKRAVNICSGQRQSSSDFDCCCLSAISFSSRESCRRYSSN